MRQREKNGIVLASLCRSYIGGERQVSQFGEVGVCRRDRPAGVGFGGHSGDLNAGVAEQQPQSLTTYVA
jgi:hypothetical protein